MGPTPTPYMYTQIPSVVLEKATTCILITAYYFLSLEISLESSESRVALDNCYCHLLAMGTWLESTLFKFQVIPVLLIFSFLVTVAELAECEKSCMDNCLAEYKCLDDPMSPVGTVCLIGCEWECGCRGPWQPGSQHQQNNYSQHPEGKSGYSTTAPSLSS